MLPTRNLTPSPAHFVTRSRWRIAGPLVITFRMEMAQVGYCGSVQRFLAEEDHALEALLFQAPQKSLDACIQIWRSRW
jgi:hypothetical protein